MLGAAPGTGSPAAERAALAGLCDTLFFAQRVEAMAPGRGSCSRSPRRAEGETGTAEAHARIGQVLVVEGRLDEAAPMLDGVIASARRRGPRVALEIALSYRGFVHYWQTEYEAAEATGVETLSIATELGDGFYALAARMILGLARANLGRISEAIDDFADAIAVARRNDDRYWLPRLVSHLGWVHRELGALERAREYDTEAVRLARERPVPGAEVEVLLNLCVDDVRRGDAEQASALLAELQARAAESSWLRWLSELRLAAASAEHWAARGDHEPRGGARGAAGRDGAAPRGARLPLRRRADPGRGGPRARRGRHGRGRPPGGRPRGAAPGYPCPLEAWKSARLLAVLRRRLGEEDAARRPSPRPPAACGPSPRGCETRACARGSSRLRTVREVLEADCAAGCDSFVSVPPEASPP